MSKAVKIVITPNNNYKLEYITQFFSQHESLFDKEFNRNEVLNIIEKGKYQFVILDYSGNEKEGEKLLKNIKLKQIKTHVVIFTNPNNNHNIILTQDDWMNDKTGKSEEPYELLNLLNKFIKYRNSDFNKSREE